MSQHTDQCLREALWNNCYHNYRTLVIPKHCTVCYHHILFLALTLLSEERSLSILKEGMLGWMTRVLRWWRIRRCGLVWQAVVSRGRFCSFQSPGHSQSVLSAFWWLSQHISSWLLSSTMPATLLPYPSHDSHGSYYPLELWASELTIFFFKFLWSWCLTIVTEK